VRQELVQRRIEQADRDRQALHDLEQRGEVLALHRQQLGQRRAPARSSSARIISRTATMRSPSKNMCSVRQRPMPSAPNFTARARIAGVSALARTLSARTLSAHCISVRELAGELRLASATRPRSTWPVEPSMVMMSPLRLRLCRPAVMVAFRIVDAQRARAGDAGLAHAARHHGRVRGHAAARREDALGGVHAVDVFRAEVSTRTRMTLAALRLQALRFVGGEHDLAARRRRARRAGRSRSLRAGLRIDGRMQQLVERAGLDPRHRLLARDQPLVRHLDGDLERGLGRALAAAGLQHPQLARSTVNSRSCMSR
jgi:hypothetical protein